MNLCRVLVCLL